MRLKILLASLFAFLVAPSLAEYKLNYQEPVTRIAQEQYDLHTFVLIVIVIIGVGVFGVMIYSIINHRKVEGRQAATFHHNTTVEIIWTIVPFLIVIGLAIPATKVILDIRDTGNSQLTIKVVGYQWKWGYDYLEDNLFFYSTITTPPEQIGPLYFGEYGTPGEQDRPETTYLLEVDKPMVVPVDTKVRLLFTAADVLHAWWVPALGVKQDTIPGIIRESWFTAEKEGTYRGQCTELCGKNHGFMPIVVEVVSKEEYADWVASEGGGVVEIDQPVSVGDVVALAAKPAEGVPTEWTMDAVMEYGEKVYTAHCVACHQANGEGLGETFPALKAAPFLDEGVEPQAKVILEGVAGTVMASFAYLTDEELAAVMTYERNAWGNDTGDLVTPEELAGYR